MLTFTYGFVSPKPGVINSRSSLSSDYKKKNHSGYTMIVRRKKKPNEAGLDFQGYHGLIFQLAAMFYYFITYTTIVRLPSHVVVFRLSEKCLTEMYQSHEY